MHILQQSSDDCRENCNNKKNEQPAWAKPGMKIGMLTFLSQDHGHTGARPKWHMLCECGNQKSIDAGAVKAGRQVSCGRFRLKQLRKKLSTDFAGQKIGMLRVIRFYGWRGNVRLWLCECDCGCGYIADAAHLGSNRVKSCGCLRRKFTDAPKSNEQLQRYARNHVRRALARGAEGSFSRDDIARIFKLQRGMCAWCSRSLASGYHKDHRTPLFLGGSNNADNIELLCPSCNTRKGAKDPLDWANLNGKLL